MFSFVSLSTLSLYLSTFTAFFCFLLKPFPFSFKILSISKYLLTTRTLFCFPHKNIPSDKSRASAAPNCLRIPSASIGQ